MARGFPVNAAALRASGALLPAYAALAAETGCVLATVIPNPVWPDRARYERRFEPSMWSPVDRLLARLPFVDHFAFRIF